MEGIREFVALKLDRKIRYEYRCKGNAKRAVTNDKYNTLTLLCYNLEQLATRSIAYENLLRDVHKTVQSTKDVWGSESDCFTTIGDLFGTSSSDSSSCAGDEGSAEAAGAGEGGNSEAGDCSTDSGDSGPGSD